MKKIIYMTTLTAILTFFGCKTKEEKYLEKHKVLFCKTDEFELFIATAKIKPKEANELMIDFANKKNLVIEASMYFIIDDYYTFTNYVHPKIPEAYTGSIWVHSKTGEVIQKKDGIFLKTYYSYDWKN
jgi:hypothetical protein